MERRDFLKGAALGAGALALGLAGGCASDGSAAAGAGSGDGAAAGDAASSAAAPQGAMTADDLPPASPDPGPGFGIDQNINMETIDNYLGIEGVEYRDMRMLEDPADYGAVGGSSLLDFALDGFLITPFPSIATLPPLPVEGAYQGPALFAVTWGEDGKPQAAEERYQQSRLILEELFPQDKRLFLMCGGAGYAGMMRDLLVLMGWNPQKVYNVGGAWDYDGYRSVQLMAPGSDGATQRYLWRAQMAIIDFDDLTPVA